MTAWSSPASGCAPFVQAIREAWTPQDALARRWPKIETVAGAIADNVVFDAHLALPAVRESGGAALATSNRSVTLMLELCRCPQRLARSCREKPR
jgi:threonine synthase